MTNETGLKTSENRPARQKGRERRRQILDVAKQRMILHGIDGLVLREIAEELDITHGNLQYYFQTKDALLKTIYEEETDKYTSKLHLFVSNASSKQGKLAAIIDSAIEVLESKETRLWRILFGIADQYPELALILKRENEHYQNEVMKELKDIAPTLTAKRLQHISRILRLVIDGMGVDLIYENPKSPQYSGLKNELKSMFSTLLELK